MRKVFIYLGVLLLVFLLIQLVRPEKNLGKINVAGDFIQESMMPDTVARLFLNSCYDCHSNHTNYPWYGGIAPVSWFLNKHVVEGKAHLNFSSWGIMDKSQKISHLDEICEECSDKAMPLKSYLLIHGSAKLSPDDIKAICEWTEKEAMKLMNTKE